MVFKTLLVLLGLAVVAYGFPATRQSFKSSLVNLEDDVNSARDKRSFYPQPFGNYGSSSIYNRNLNYDQPFVNGVRQGYGGGGLSSDPFRQGELDSYRRGQLEGFKQGEQLGILEGEIFELQRELEEEKHHHHQHHYDSHHHGSDRHGRRSFHRH